MNQLDRFLETFFYPLKLIHEPLDLWLGSLPMSVAMGCALGLYLVAAVWVWRLKPKFVYRGASSNSPLLDLRLWATLVMIPYVLIYLILGR